MKRGELWTVAGGVYASKPRPALVLQADEFGETDSVTVVPLTTALVDAPMLRVPLDADGESGLSKPSHAMIDKVTTIRRSNAVARVGSVPAKRLGDVERALIVFLGLA